MDKSAPVASAVLVSAMHLLKDNLEIVKRWTSEIQEVVQSKNGMVQYHAVALLHALRSKDRLAVSKLVSSLVRGNVRSPMAQCLLVRYVAQVRPCLPCPKSPSSHIPAQNAPPATLSVLEPTTCTGRRRPGMQLCHVWETAPRSNLLSVLHCYAELSYGPVGMHPSLRHAQAATCTSDEDQGCQICSTCL